MKRAMITGISGQDGSYLVASPYGVSKLGEIPDLKADATLTSQPGRPQ